MAPPQCESGDGNPAVFVGTFLQTGQPVALCDDCLVPWSAALLQAMTGVDPTPFLAAISDGADSSPAAPGVQDSPPAPPPAGGPDPQTASETDGPTSQGSPGAGTDTAPPGDVTPIRRRQGRAGA